MSSLYLVTFKLTFTQAILKGWDSNHNIKNLHHLFYHRKSFQPCFVARIFSAIFSFDCTVCTVYICIICAKLKKYHPIFSKSDKMELYFLEKVKKWNCIFSKTEKLRLYFSKNWKIEVVFFQKLKNWDCIFSKTEK